MDKSKSIVFQTVAGYVLTALGILWVGLLLVPAESRSDLFWPRMLWTGFLALIIWGTVFSFLYSTTHRDSKDREIIGVLPAASIVLIIYAVLSFLLVIGQAYVSANAFGDRAHLVLQVCIAVIAGIIFVFFSVASKQASIGLEKKFEAGLSPADLCDVLREHETRVHQFPAHPVWHQFNKSLKTLREGIRGSIPHIGKIGITAEYHDFSQDVKLVCDDLAIHSDHTDANLVQIQNRLDMLISRLKTMSSKSIRR